MSLIITATGPAASGSIDYDAVRAAIDLSLTDADLPDATIDRSPFAPAAWAEVLARDPDAASRTGAEAARVGRAWVYLTAARLVLVPGVGDLLSEKFTNYAYTRAGRNPQKYADYLNGLAEMEFAAYLEASGRVQPPTFFTVASPARGRCCR